MLGSWPVEMDNIEQALCLARLSALQGDMLAARRLYQESLQLLFEGQFFQELIAESLEGLAALETAQGRPYWAAGLWGGSRSTARSHRRPHLSDLS